MEIEDVAWTPEALAEAIHKQLGHVPPPIPVHEIARALDIYEIREVPLSACEGMLVTNAERIEGLIAVNSRASPYRRRYSLGHELGHFLCRWHSGTEDNVFHCTRRDMAHPAGDKLHRQQEAEANRFSIELLAPTRFLAPFLKRLPDLEHVLTLSNKLEISKAAAARRFVDLHPARLAAVFAKNGRFLYAHRSAGFPWLPLNKGETLPALPVADGGGDLSDMEERDPSDWFGSAIVSELGVQLLRQEDGHATVLLEVS